MINTRVRSPQVYLFLMGNTIWMVVSVLHMMTGSDPRCESFLVGFMLLFGAISHLIEVLFFIWKKLHIT